MKMTQINFVKSELKNKGFISRNACLRGSRKVDTHHITRLSDIVFRLKNKGWEISRDEKLNGKRKPDCVYKLVSMPEEEEIA